MCCWQQYMAGSLLLLSSICGNKSIHNMSDFYTIIAKPEKLERQMAVGFEFFLNNFMGVQINPYSCCLQLENKVMVMCYPPSASMAS